MEISANKRTVEGKKVILLGASSGIGLATAKAAAAEGAKVVIVSGNRQRIDQALEGLPENSEGYAIDLSKEDNIREFFGRTGSFDHLVFTAGDNLPINYTGQTDIETARHFLDLRFWGAFAAVKYGAPHINKGGSICLTSGIAGRRPLPGWSVIAALCGAMESLVRALAVELAPIRVNSIVPGVVKTNLWNSMPEADQLLFSIGETLPVRQVGEAEDVAQAFLYLMKQPYSTGQNIVLDGGATLI